MSTTTPSRNGAAPLDAPQSPSLPDEEALRRVFYAEFAGLMREAEGALGDATAQASRVVENAFVRAWAVRATLATTEDVRAFLHDEVYHAAARVLSRRAAAHRVGHRDETAPNGRKSPPNGTTRPSAVTATTLPPPATVDEAWGHVLRTIHGEGHSADALAKAAEVSRHDAAHHVADIGKPRGWKIPVAVGVVAIALTIAGVRWMDRMGQSAAVERAVDAPDARVTSSYSGRMAVVTLGDGSKVRLQPETRVSVPVKFGPRFRAIRVSGAATIEPVANPKEALRVYARNAIFDATGTVFSVRDWDNDPGTLLKVREGTVIAHVGDVERPVTAGQSLFVEPNGTMRAPTAAELETLMGWTDGNFVAVDRPLGEVLPMLKRWYGLDVKTAEPSLKERKVTVRAPLASAREAVAAIEQSGSLVYTYVDRELAFRDAAAKPGAKKK